MTYSYRDMLCTKCFSAHDFALHKIYVWTLTSMFHLVTLQVISFSFSNMTMTAFEFCTSLPDLVTLINF